MGLSILRSTYSPFAWGFVLKSQAQKFMEVGHNI